MKGDLQSVVDSTAGEWPDVHVQQLAHLALSCMELSRRCRPDLSGEVWRVVEAMRDAATSIPSASSSRPVSDENCTPSYFVCPISQVCITWIYCAFTSLSPVREQMYES